jgi:hypothetical protein
MKTFLLWFVIVPSFLATVTGGALAQAQPTACTPATALIAHGNGILTDFDSALDSIEALRRRALPADLQGVRFAVAYNPTNGFIADIFESAVQDLSTDVTQFWRYWNNLLPMPDNLRRLVEERVAQIDEAALVNTDSLRRHVDLYSVNLLEGKKVLLVAHSQGTFYANQAFTLLTAENPENSRSFGIVSVALMDHFVAGEPPYPYITLHEDSIVNVVRAAKELLGQPGPLPGTTTNLLTTLLSDPRGHDFVDSYLAANSILPAQNSRNDIAGAAVNTLNALEAPPVRAEEGIITVTLTWGARPDVDLHIFEPDGSHVYYDNRVGPAGFLDVDDRDGSGPEHYFVSCEMLEPGNYFVLVNYYHGSAPETARVLIQAGHLEIREFRSRFKIIESIVSITYEWC